MLNFNFKKLWEDLYGHDVMPDTFPRNFSWGLDQGYLKSNYYTGEPLPKRSIGIMISRYAYNKTYHEIGEEYDISASLVGEICHRMLRHWRSHRQLLIDGRVTIRVPYNYKSPNVERYLCKETYLNDTPLITKAANALMRRGINTIGNLIELSEDEIPNKIKGLNIGPKTLETIFKFRSNMIAKLD